MSEMYWKVKVVGKPHLARGYAACGFLTKQDVLVGCSPKIMFQMASRILDETCTMVIEADLLPEPSKEPTNAMMTSQVLAV